MSVAMRAVSDDEADIRLDRWFRRHYPFLPQSAIQKLCRTGQIRVDGHRAEAATRLAPGQAVRIPPMPAEAARPAAPQVADPRARQELEDLVLFRDEHLIVLNKPAGLAVQGGPGITRHLDGMLDLLRGDGAAPAAPGASAGPRHLRRSAAGPHARHRRQSWPRCFAGGRSRRPIGPSSSAARSRSRAASTCR